MKPEIRHGELLDVIGAPVRFGNCTFVPANVVLHGSAFSPQFDFVDWCALSAIAIPPIVNRDLNAPWVLGRLLALFDTENTPEDEREEKCCFHASFIAIAQEFEHVAAPFTASDVYGRTSLWFSDEGAPPQQLRTAIAHDFYNLILKQPESLVDYQNRMYHPGAGAWIDFGVDCGEPYMVEREY